MFGQEMNMVRTFARDNRENARHNSYGSQRTRSRLELRDVIHKAEKVLVSSLFISLQS